MNLLSLSICLFWTFDRNRTVYYVFCMFSVNICGRFLQDLSCATTSSLFTDKQYSIPLVYSALFIPSSPWGSFGLLLLWGYSVAVINIIANCMGACLIVHWVQTETRTAVSHDNSVVTFWRPSKLFSKVAAVFIISRIMSEDAKFSGSGFLLLLPLPHSPPPFPPHSWQGLTHSVIQAGLKLMAPLLPQPL